MNYKKVKLFGINFDNLDMDGALNSIDELISTNRKTRVSSFIVTPNVDHIVNIEKSKDFKKAYDNASLVFVDGMPIVLLSRLLKKPLLTKLSGADLTPKLLEHSHKKEYKIFIFGSNPGVADIVVKQCKEKFGLNFKIDCYSPRFGFERDREELLECIDLINKFSPDILFVSLGSPKGELFIYNNLKLLKVPVSIQVGAAIDFMAGTVKRAPVWMQKVSLEWLYRFLKEPKRMFKRYFVNDLYFIKVILKELLN